jgi:alpha-maltose-1-phosphate synthase
LIHLQRESAAGEASSLPALCRIAASPTAELWSPGMQVIQAVSGVFHHFDLARELESRGHLKCIYSTFPWKRLKREGLPQTRVGNFPWLHTPWLAVDRYWKVPRSLAFDLAFANFQLFDSWVASRIEECDAFVALSGSGLKTGGVVRGRSGKYVCDRGSSHIRYQDAILTEEYARWGLSEKVCDPRMIEREEAEYAEADAITIASEFSRRTFIEMGVPAGKIYKIPYGVRLERFRQTAEPAKDRFEVLFAGQVSLRKGVPYLIEAFRLLKHPAKRLRLVGSVDPAMKTLLDKMDLSGVEVLGRMPQEKLAECMSSSHVLVLPSIEDGFGLVMAQAMACGAVIVSSVNTGGPDLYEDGKEGFIVPIRDPQAIANRLQQLAEDPALRQRMSEASLRRVRNIGGWSEYGEQYTNFLKQLTGA